MNNLEKFKEHLREAKKAGWELKSILGSIRFEKCPFDCTLCNQACFIDYVEECLIFVDKRGYYNDNGIWRKQTAWYELAKNKDLIKIAKQVWKEK